MVFLKFYFIYNLPIFIYPSFVLFSYLYPLIGGLLGIIPIKIPETIGLGMILFFIMLIYNLIYTLIFKFIKYKNNDNKYLILTLCYIHNIIIPITFFRIVG